MECGGFVPFFIFEVTFKSVCKIEYEVIRNHICIRLPYAEPQENKNFLKEVKNTNEKGYGSNIGFGNDAS